MMFNGHHVSSSYRILSFYSCMVVFFLAIVLLVGLSSSRFQCPNHESREAEEVIPSPSSSPPLPFSAPLPRELDGPLIVPIMRAATPGVKLAFFDLGAASGNSLTAFLEGGSALGKEKRFGGRPAGDWEYWIFEANPKFSAALEDLIIRYRKLYPTHKFFLFNQTAIGTRDGNTTFYISPSKSCNDCGSSVLRVNDRVIHDANSRPIEITVPMVNLMRLIRENYKPEDYVILNIDLQGLEFEILRRLLVDGLLPTVDEIYCEFHDFAAEWQYLSALRWIYDSSATKLHV